MWTRVQAVCNAIERQLKLSQSVSSTLSNAKKLRQGRDTFRSLAIWQTSKIPQIQAASWIAASKVSSTTVYDTAGEKVGSIYDIMIDKISGKAEYAILSFGGFLGMGSSYHPLPWRTLVYDGSKGGYVVNIDRKRLEGAPAYSETGPDMWADPNYGHQVDAFYNW